MENENLTAEGLAGDAHMTASAPHATVGNVAPATASPAVAEPTLSLKEINEYLGKDFKDSDSAKKAIKDTFAFVGKKTDDIKKEIGGDTTAVVKELAEIKENMFYEKNKDYAPYRGAISKMGGNPETVVNSPEFKALFGNALGYDKSQSLKSVLDSNPRLASSRDKFTQGREALKSGNKEEGEALVTNAVLESLNL